MWDNHQSLNFKVFMCNSECPHKCDTLTSRPERWDYVSAALHLSQSEDGVVVVVFEII